MILLILSNDLWTGLPWLLRSGKTGKRSRGSGCTMRRLAAMTGVLTGMLIGLPLPGVMCAGADIRRYLEFPPVTRYVSHAPFSWPVFAGGTALVLVMLVVF